VDRGRRHPRPGPCGLPRGGGGTKSADQASQARGPIKIWYSNNQDEVKWGKAVVATWNQAHGDQKVTAEEIPAGKSSEEVIGASITAGNTPCLVLNTGRGGPAGASVSPVLLMYTQGIEQGKAGYAAAIGILLALGVMAVSLVNRYLLERS